MARILDQFGQPYSDTRPPRALDVAATAGVQQPAQHWGQVASCLTPERAAQVLKSAKAGDAEAYLTLAEELEERDLHYASVVQTRKLAVVGCDVEVTPGDDSATARRAAERFRAEVVEQDGFEDFLFDLMDAVAKGYSVVQLHWDTSTGRAQIAEYEWIDPRMFQFDLGTLRELRLRSPGKPDGVPMPGGLFVAHYPKIKTGVRIRGGIAMLGTIAHVAKSFTLAAWLAFAEVYGMPLRLAKYDPENMTQREIDALKIAVANIGHDAAALIPNGSTIEILDGRTPAANGKNIFEGLSNFWDAQLSKCALGQTMTTDDGSSKAQADVHDRVRMDIKRADARSLMSTVRCGVAVPWTRFNYGPRVAPPKCRLAVDPPEDLLSFSQAIVPLIEKGGLRVIEREVCERFGLTPVEDAPAGAHIMQAAPKAAADPKLDPNAAVEVG